MVSFVVHIVQPHLLCVLVQGSLCPLGWWQLIPIAEQSVSIKGSPLGELDVILPFSAEQPHVEGTEALMQSVLEGSDFQTGLNAHIHGGG